MEDKRVELERMTPREEHPLVRPGYPTLPGYPADSSSYGYGYPTPDKGGINFRAIWRTVLKRKWLILVIVFIVTSAATIEVYRTKSIYKATASIEVRKDAATLMKAQNIVIQTDDSDAMNTYMYMIKSRPLLLEVAASLRLDQNPKFFEVTSRKSITEAVQTVFNRVRLSNDPKAPAVIKDIPATDLNKEMTPEEKAKWSPYAGVIGSGLGVEQLPAARLIMVSFTHTDPETAAAVANTVAQHFIVQNFKSKTENFTKTSEWLDRTTRELKAKVEQAEQAQATYLRDHDMSFVGRSGNGSGNVGTDKLLHFYEQVQRIEGERILKQSLYEEVKKGNILTLPEIFTDTQMGELQKKLRELRVQKSQLEVNYGDKHPKIIEITEQIATVEEQIKANVGTLEAKLKADYEKALREEKQLKAILEQSKGEATQQNRAEIEYTMLKQEVETQRALYKEFLTKTSQADLQRVEQNNNLQLAEPAEAPGAPIGPDRLKTIFTWMLLSFAGGIGLAFFLEYLDNTIKTVEDVATFAQLPALAAIPAMAGRNMRKLAAVKKGSGSSTAVAKSDTFTMPGQVAALEARSSVAEAYRVLRTSVMLSSAGGPPKIMLVTSGQPGEGKTTTTVNTAVSLAQLGASVLIIDCDLRKPSTHKVFGVDHSRGISTYLSRDVELDGLIQKLPIANLSLLPCGPIPPNPAELISSDKMKEMLRTLSERFDHILIDSPPLMHVTDPVILSTMTDGVILVVQAGKTTRDVLRRTRQELTAVGAKIFGVVLNNVDYRKNGYDDYYHYRYYESYGQERNEASGD
ncbi:MAG: polysaccharide biosynthesis tyrosine autokinase [Acidobacteria bacterium]|nr:polysaccharide biosynthesis tyrosine autokinase [Acidobacteriota bacterium]